MTPTHTEGLFADFGERIAAYSGGGSLTDGAGVTLSGQFHAVQLQNGDVVIVFETVRLTQAILSGNVQSISGTTTDGWTMESEGPFTPFEWGLGLGSSARVTLYARALLMHAPQASSAPATYRYGITNFEFTPTHQTEYKQPNRWAIDHTSYRLSTGKGPIDVTVFELPSSRSTLRRIKRQKSAAVTAEIRCPAWPVGELDAIANTLVRVLSIARGTKVEWLYRDRLDASGRVVEHYHEARITKPYSPFPPLDPASIAETKSFVEGGFSAYNERREAYRLDHITNAYIEARIDSHYVEARGVLLAVALEGLKHALAEQQGKDGGWVVPEKKAKTLASDMAAAISAALAAKNIDPAIISHATSRAPLKGLFRKTFRQLLHALDDALGIKPLAGEELSFFIKSRDSLVHQGRFVRPLDGTTQGGSLPHNMVEELLFDTYVLDHYFLALLNYRGAFHDVRTPTVAEPTAKIE
jgi:hypothetical protein